MNTNGQAKQVVADWQVHQELNTLDAMQDALCKAQDAAWVLTKMVHKQRAKVRRMERRNRVIVITP